METVTLLWWLLGLALVIGGLAGAVLPVLPGLPMVFAGLLIFAWTDDFQRVGSVTMTVLVALLLLGIAMDFVASALGSKRVGASPRAITGAMLGSIVGIFFGPLGLVLGPFIGAVLGELGARGSIKQATASGVGALIGLLLGTIAKLALGLAMIGLFLFAWFV